MSSHALCFPVSYLAEVIGLREAGWFEAAANVPWVLGLSVGAETKGSRKKAHNQLVTKRGNN